MFKVDADGAAIAGELLSLEVTPEGQPASGVDRFRLYDLQIVAFIPQGTVISIQ